MAKIDIEIDDALLSWTKQAARNNELTVSDYIGMLLLLESDLRRTVADGRTLRTRAFMYRDGADYFVPEASEKV